MWAGFEARLQGILESLEYHCEQVTRMLAVTDSAEAIRHSRAEFEVWKRQERELNAVSITECTWCMENIADPPFRLQAKIRNIMSLLGTDEALQAVILERYFQD